MRTVATVALIACSALGLAQGAADDPFQTVHIVPFGDPSTVTLAGEIAILGITDGIKIVDVSDPAAPRSLSRIAIPGEVLAITVDGDTAYVAAGDAGVAVVDLATPTYPTLVRVIDTPGQAKDVAVSGDWVFVADSSGGFRAVPSQPNGGESYVVEGLNAYEVAISAGLAYVRESGNVWLIDVAEPSMMVTRSILAINAVSVSADGHLLLVGSVDDELIVFDCTQPTNPLQIGSYTLAGDLRDLASSEAFVWLVETDYEVFYGLRVIDVSDPANPHEVGSLDLGGYLTEISVEGERALIGTTYQAPVVDISDPANPVQVGNVASTASPLEIWTVGDLALVEVGWSPWADFFLGIDILDLSDPWAPKELATISPPDGYLDASVDGSIVALVNDKLHIYDIQTPARPTHLSATDVPCVPSAVAVSGDLVFMADECGLRVFDISDPTAPEELGFVVPSYWEVNGLRAAGDGLYGSYNLWGNEFWGGGYYVFDVADPADPSEIGDQGSGYPAEFVVEGNRAYVLGTGGSIGRVYGDVVVYELGPSRLPVLLGRINLAFGWDIGQASALTTIGNQIVASFDQTAYLIGRESLMGPEPVDLGHVWIECMAAMGDFLIAGDSELGLMILLDNEVFADDFETGNTTAWEQHETTTSGRRLETR